MLSSRRVTVRALPLLTGVLLPACSAGPGDLDPHWRASQVHASGGDIGLYATPPMDIDGSSAPPAPTGRVTSVTVEVSEDGSTWAELPGVTWLTSGPYALDLVMVADNSGSEAAWLDEIIESVSQFGDRILTRSPEDRVGLVRVSTEASVLCDLTADRTTFSEAAAGLFENDGWTALWDGLRLGNEVLEAGALDTDDGSGALSVCVDEHYRAILVYTDGAENNSADEHATSYDGDGIDTTLADVEALAVHEVATPIHTVAVGDEVDAPTLEAISAATGGRHVEIDRYATLRGTLESAASAFERTVPVCFTVDDCTMRYARVTVVTTEGHDTTTDSFDVDLPEVCG